MAVAAFIKENIYSMRGHSFRGLVRYGHDERCGSVQGRRGAGEGAERSAS